MGSSPYNLPLDLNPAIGDRIQSKIDSEAIAQEVRLATITRTKAMTDETQSILAANREFYRAFEKKDLEAMSAIWSKGTGCSCVHPGRGMIRGWDAIRTSWEKIFSQADYLEIEIDSAFVEANGNIAYVTLTENVMQVTRRRRLQAQSIATNIFEAMSGRWYLVHHHGSPLLR